MGVWGARVGAGVGVLGFLVSHFTFQGFGFEARLAL
jgi:hypothetical protein